VVGSPNIVLEITLFDPSVTGGNNVLELLVGTHSRLAGVANVANASTAYTLNIQAATTTSGTGSAMTLLGGTATSGMEELLL
jgi:hypothetical protein